MWQPVSIFLNYHPEDIYSKPFQTLKLLLFLVLVCFSTQPQCGFALILSETTLPKAFYLHPKWCDQAFFSVFYCGISSVALHLPETLLIP